MEKLLAIPSPLERILLPLFDEKKIEVHIKRDDLIHDEISGNKYRKLKYNIHHALNAKKDAILTFGGAYSNHIAATAAACQFFGIKSIGIIRGEDADLNNSTLARAISNGMQIIRVSREEYATKDEPIYIEHLHEKFPNVHIVPEGGANYFGLNGCAEILKEINQDFNFVICGVGTGTTLAGMAISLEKNQKIIGFPAIKGGEYLMDEIKHQINYALLDENWMNDILQKIELNHDYSFGGFAKVNDELIAFQKLFYEQTKIELDLVYTAKMMFGFLDLVQKNNFPEGSKIIIYHSGGLQGNKSLNN